MIVAGGGGEAPVGRERDGVEPLGVAAQRGAQAVGAGVGGDDARRAPAIERGRQAGQPAQGAVRLAGGGGAGLHQGEIVGVADRLPLRGLRRQPRELGPIARGDRALEAHADGRGDRHQRRRPHRERGAEAAHGAQHDLAGRVLVRAHHLARGEARQVGGELARGGVAIGRVAGHGLVDDGAQLQAHRALAALQRRRRPRGDRAEHGAHVAPSVGRDAREHVVEDGAERVHVRPLVDRRAPGLLRGHVRGRAHHRAGHGQPLGGAVRRGARARRRRPFGIRGAGRRSPARVDRRLGGEILGEAPVDDHRLAERADEDVGGLEVAVDDALAVRVGHGLGHRHHVREQPKPLRQRPRRRVGALSGGAVRGGAFGGEDVGERSPGDQLHRVEELSRGPAPRLVHGHDRRVLEARGEQRLADEALGGRVPGLEQLLDGHGAVEVHAPPAQDAAHAAVGDLARDLVAVALDDGEARGAPPRLGIEAARAAAPSRRGPWSPPGSRRGDRSSPRHAPRGRHHPVARRRSSQGRLRPAAYRAVRPLRTPEPRLLARSRRHFRHAAARLGRLVGRASGRLGATRGGTASPGRWARDRFASLAPGWRWGRPLPVPRPRDRRCRGRAAR